MDLRIIGVASAVVILIIIIIIIWATVEPSAAELNEHAVKVQAVLDNTPDHTGPGIADLPIDLPRNIGCYINADGRAVCLPKK